MTFASNEGSLTMEYIRTSYMNLIASIVVRKLNSLIHVHLLTDDTASGMSKQQYKKLKEQERKKSQGKNLGKVGITSFQSRSFSDWQASGGKNLFPVDPRSVGNVKEIPYM